MSQQINPKDEKKIQEISGKLQNKKPLTQAELEFINSTEFLRPEDKLYVNSVDKQTKGQELTDEEQEFMKKLQEQQQQQQNGELPVSPESSINKEEFEKERAQIQDTGFQIHHITDIHNKAEQLEGLLANSLFEAGHLEENKNGQIEFMGHRFNLKENVPITLTGDLGSDFFDQQNHGLEAFLADAVIDKPNFTQEEEEEFRKNYEFIMEKAGFDENMIKEMTPTAFGEGGPYSMFMAYLFGYQDPHFLNKKEKKEFINKRNKVQTLLKKGMKHHARREYGIIRDSLDKMGLGADKVAIVSGNHDVPEIMQEILGEYMVNPGQTRNVAGVNFGNVVNSANGNFTNGPDFNDVFGYAGLREELDKVRYDSEPFKKLKSLLNDKKDGLGLDFDDKTIKRYMDISIQRAAQGIGAGHLGELFKKEIEPILKDHVNKRIEALKDNIPQGADVILQHSMLDDPQRAGLEEKAAHELISKHLGPGTIVLHGHEHGPTPHRRDNIFHLNPGSAASGNSATHMFDKNKNYVSSLFKGMDNNMLDTYRYQNMRNIAGQASGKYQ